MICRTRLTIDPRIPTFPAWNTSGFSPTRQDIACTKREASAERCLAGRMTGELHPTLATQGKMYSLPCMVDRSSMATDPRIPRGVYFSFFFFFFFLFFFFVFFPLLLVVLRVPLPRPCSFFVRFVLSSCRFPFVSCIAFFAYIFASLLSLRLGGGFCYSVISPRRYTPPALLASLKHAYSPCVLSSFLRC